MTFFSRAMPVAALLAFCAFPAAHAAPDAPAPGTMTPNAMMHGPMMMGPMMMPHHPHVTMLSFSTQGVAKAVPTVLSLHFTAYSQSTSPAEAQATLNHMVEDAMKQAAGQTDITTVAGNYNLSQDYSEHGPQHWSARQDLTLSGTNAPRLLKLAEKFQAAGLGLESMNWSFTEATREKLLDTARDEALSKIRSRAEADARVLGLHLRGLAQVSVTEEPSNAPRPYMLMAARSSAPVPPQSTPGEQSVHVTVHVKAILCRHAPGEHPHHDASPNEDDAK